MPSSVIEMQPVKLFCIFSNGYFKGSDETLTVDNESELT